MILNLYIRKLLKDKIGNQLTQSSQLEMLSSDIYHVTGERLSINTLKRLFGYLPDVNTSMTTLNIIAEYLGFDNWQSLYKVSENGNSQLNELDNTFIPDKMNEGTVFDVKYEPDRRLRLKVLSDGRCLVLESDGGKIISGDILSVAEITIGSTFVVSIVERGKQQLGRYVGGIEGGIKSVTKVLIDEEN